jgi:uncharacterized membrane protein (DUF485 family)
MNAIVLTKKVTKRDVLMLAFLSIVIVMFFGFAVFVGYKLFLVPANVSISRVTFAVMIGLAGLFFAWQAIRTYKEVVSVKRITLEDKIIQVERLGGEILLFTVPDQIAEITHIDDETEVMLSGIHGNACVLRSKDMDQPNIFCDYFEKRSGV